MLIENIEQALDHRKPWQMLRIPDALKAEFASYEAVRKRGQVETALSIGIFVFVALLAVDWMIIPDVYELNVVLRVFVGAPIGLAVLFYVHRYSRSPSQHTLAGVMYALICAVICSGVLTLSDSEAAPIYMTGNNVMLAFVIVVLRPSFVFGAIAAVAILAIEIVAVTLSPFFSTTIFASTVGVTAALAVPLLYANWCLNNEKRRHFLNEKRDERRLKIIERNRDMLGRLAAIDELTGVMNRRGFDAAFCGDLENAGPDAIVAIAMIDIDNFKKFNDRYGHPAGDEALRRVARALETAGPSNTRVGRFGGEEFAVAIVGPELKSLDFIGAQLRACVKRLNIRHEDNGGHDWVTVSVGLAWGKVQDGDPRKLFSLADKALYEAKANGRDKVILRPSLKEMVKATYAA